jgi:hypothetical protein
LDNKDKNSEFDVDIPENIKEAFERMKAGRGDCPASEELVNFQQLSLPAEEMARIKRHIEGCGICDRIVQGLTEFDEVTRKDPEGIKWSSRLLHFMLNPAVAYLVALALLYPAYRGIFHSSTEVVETMEEQKQQVDSASDFDLGEGTLQRGIGATPSVEKVISIPKEERFFILNLFIPVRSDLSYKMEVQDEKDAVISTTDVQSRDRLGNFSIVCTRELFPPGSYRIRIQELDPKTRQPLAEYLFRFKVMD